MNAGQIYEYIDRIAPFSGQEEWDNSGFQVGERTKEVRKILFALDATADLVYEAYEKQCDLIVTHHPFLFRAQKQFTEQNPAYLAAKYNIAVISAHTSYDCADGGVNDVLSETLGLRNIQKTEDGLCRIGDIDRQTALDFAKKAKTVLHTCVSVSLPQKEIATVAVCGGAGMEFAEQVKAAGADLFLTGEARHHEILEAYDADLAVIIAGHFATEHPAVISLQKRVQTDFPEIECILSEQITPTVTV
ncbi:MAG: Nif3-like dinuclear metal center hexameric protein [Candidatus Fimenecus sp.]